MAQVGIRELRQDASRWVGYAEHGETIEVTRHGKVVAILAPPPAGNDRRQQLIDAGLLIPGTGRVQDIVPIELADPGAVSRALAAERAEDDR